MDLKREEIRALLRLLSDKLFLQGLDEVEQRLMRKLEDEFERKLNR